jgi:hypothetical protein
MEDLAPFESPKMLIDEAKASIADFKVACDLFVQDHTYNIINEVDRNTREQVIKLRFLRKMPPRLRITASHIVNDLRHSLDQAVCDGAVLLGRKHARGVHFPFAKSAAEFENEAKNRLKDVHSDLVAFVKGFKAHYGGDGLLYAVGSLAGPNKHQRILQISADNTGAKVRMTGNWSFTVSGPAAPGLSDLSLGLNKWNDLRNELEFIRASPHVAGNIDARPALQVVLGTGEAPFSGPAASVLHAFAGKVEGIVSAIEAETIRLKT